MEKLDVVNAALAALRAGETCELVVVAGTAGSSPRGVGAWMAVFADGSQAGTIGGGKIELFALDEARELLSAGQSRLVRYTMGGENSDTGMICGGAICLCYLHLDATQAPLPRGPDLHLWLRTRGRRDGARAHGGGLCRRGLR